MQVGVAGLGRATSERASQASFAPRPLPYRHSPWSIVRAALGDQATGGERNSLFETSGTEPCRGTTHWPRPQRLDPGQLPAVRCRVSQRPCGYRRPWPHVKQQFSMAVPHSS